MSRRRKFPAGSGSFLTSGIDDIDGRDRRDAQRHRLDLQLVLCTDGLEDGTLRIPATLIDLSVGGMLIETNYPVELQQPVELTFSILPNLTCHAQGDIVRAHGADRWAVRFAAIDQGLGEFILDLDQIRPDLRPLFLSRVMSPQLGLRARLR